MISLAPISLPNHRNYTVPATYPPSRPITTDFRLRMIRTRVPSVMPTPAAEEQRFGIVIMKSYTNTIAANNPFPQRTDYWDEEEQREESAQPAWSSISQEKETNRPLPKTQSSSISVNTQTQWAHSYNVSSLLDPRNRSTGAHSDEDEGISL